MIGCRADSGRNTGEHRQHSAVDVAG
jgi:hypothetical protein